jgi:hypothetical protein
LALERFAITDPVLPFVETASGTEVYNEQKKE